MLVCQCRDVAMNVSPKHHPISTPDRARAPRCTAHPSPATATNANGHSPWGAKAKVAANPPTPPTAASTTSGMRRGAVSKVVTREGYPPGATRPFTATVGALIEQGAP